ncbi:class I SAM-dependent methyltransferase [Paludibaculum fermentans]|uniref:class I SAM-dependent methyltransferase n=1 Tax=Paludibaculum fermentans TaxID=1473598 RepID=UPI003EB9DAD9
MAAPENGPDTRQVLERELRYHEELYSGFAQMHFARPAVRALRRNMVRRILTRTRIQPNARVLSIGCGIGDTELLLAPHTGHVTCLDLSPAAIRQGRADAERQGIRNVEFVEGTSDAVAGRKFDAVIAIFFLHHLPDPALERFPRELNELLEPGGAFYSLDPSVNRLSGKVGRLLVPKLMEHYQTDDERELHPGRTAELFRSAFPVVHLDFYDFGSSPLAGLFPGWAAGYHLARWADNAILTLPPLRRMGSNFEIIAHKD